MTRHEKHAVLGEVFAAIAKDGQWHEVTAPSGYRNLYRTHGHDAGMCRVYVVEARSGNGFRPGDTIGTVTVSADGEAYTNPLTFKRYLHQWKG